MWVLEYSDEQDKYHIETLKERNSRPINNYRLIKSFYKEIDAWKYLKELTEKRIDENRKLLDDYKDIPGLYDDFDFTFREIDF